METNAYERETGNSQSFLEKEKYCERQFANGGPFWHFFTDGREQEIVFTNSDDFKFGMNQLALSALICNVRIIAFAVMDNHIHVIAQCPMICGNQMFEQFSGKIARYLKSVHRPIARNLFKLQQPIEITNLKMLRSEIVYVIRNGFVANPNYTPVSYPWGSGTVFYQPLSASNPMPFNSIPFKTKRAILRSRVFELPETMLVEDGLILPQCFCDFRYGESFFRDAHHYFHMLSKDLEASGEIAKRLNDTVFYTDEELYSAISLHTRKIYGISNPQLVEAGQKIEIAKKMHHDYNCSNKQIQRLLKLDSSVINSLFPQSSTPR